MLLFKGMNEITTCPACGFPCLPSTLYRIDGVGICSIVCLISCIGSGPAEVRTVDDALVT